VREKIAVITGGEGDLAQAIQACLLESGWIVHAPGHPELDVRRADQVAAWFARFDAIDLLVNNAGITRDAPFLRLTEADWDEVVDTNLKGAFLCSQAVFPAMQGQGGGHIVQIGSFSAIRPPAGQAAYAAAKAGLMALSQSLAAEWSPENIRVNCVLPGFLETKMTAILSVDVVQAAKSAHSLGRFNTTESVGRFLLDLQDLEHVSGQTFQLDSRPRRW